MSGVVHAVLDLLLRGWLVCLALFAREGAGSPPRRPDSIEADDDRTFRELALSRPSGRSPPLPSSI